MTLVRWEAMSRCDLCGGDDFQLLFTSPDLTERLVDGEFRIVRCRCGLVFIDPRPATQDLAQVYPSDYLPHRGRAIARVAGWQRLASARDAAPGVAAPWVALRQHLSFYLWPRWRGAGDVLDVGCGAGGFLDVLEQLGWTTHGVDVAAVIDAVRAKGHDARTGNAESLPFPDASFDVVYMSHVLEHTVSPRRALLEARRVLRPGGQLIVAVPNFGGLQARAFRRWFSGLDVPRHIYQFDRRTLGRYLGEVGFERVVATSRSGAASFVKTVRLMVNDLFGARLRNEPGWAVAAFEPVALAMWPFAAIFGGGRDLRVTCEAPR